MENDVEPSVVDQECTKQPDEAISHVTSNIYWAVPIVDAESSANYDEILECLQSAEAKTCRRDATLNILKKVMGHMPDECLEGAAVCLCNPAQEDGRQLSKSENVIAVFLPNTDFSCQSILKLMNENQRLTEQNALLSKTCQSMYQDKHQLELDMDTLRKSCQNEAWHWNPMRHVVLPTRKNSASGVLSNSKNEPVKACYPAPETVVSASKASNLRAVPTLHLNKTGRQLAPIQSDRLRINATSVIPPYSASRPSTHRPSTKSRAPSHPMPIVSMVKDVTPVRETGQSTPPPLLTSTTAITKKNEVPISAVQESVPEKVPVQSSSTEVVYKEENDVIHDNNKPNSVSKPLNKLVATAAHPRRVLRSMHSCVSHIPCSTDENYNSLSYIPTIQKRNYYLRPQFHYPKLSTAGRHFSNAKVPFQHEFLNRPITVKLHTFDQANTYLKVQNIANPLATTSPYVSAQLPAAPRILRYQSNTSENTSLLHSSLSRRIAPSVIPSQRYLPHPLNV